MKIVDESAIDLTELVRPGDVLMWGQAAAEPLTLTRAAMAQRHATGGFEAFIGATWSEVADPKFADVVRFRSYCGAARNRALAAAGMLDILPCHYSQLPRLIRSRALKVDVLMLQVAPPDVEGRYSLSLAHDYLVAALEVARAVVVEINDQAPWSYGARYLVEADIDYAVSVSRAIPEPARAAPTDAERAVARRVAGLIEDGATLQLGIGAMPEAVLAELTNHRNLGLHSGALVEQAAVLARAGAITNARKSIDPGLAVVGVCMGGQQAREYVHRNDGVCFRSADYTHAPDVLASIDRFVAINSAVEVDLTGQVNAEVADGVYVGAVGGAADFLRGARCSRGGLPIVALTSTVGSAERRRSRIVARLNGPVSKARSDVRFVVTEHGVADLEGLSLSRRVQRMLTLAAPEFRDQLAREAAALGLTC